MRHRYARCRRSAGVEGHITSERNASEPERSHVRPQAAEPTGPHREGEEPKPMMHGHEKSDSAIVATKPPNKAGRPAAEAVERRAEAKENANRCRTCRTQGRESVSPTPERVRKAEASRQTSEVGAVCRKAARTVLCGGRPVMGVPTAIARSEPARHCPKDFGSSPSTVRTSAACNRISGPAPDYRSAIQASDDQAASGRLDVAAMRVIRPPGRPRRLSPTSSPLI